MYKYHNDFQGGSMTHLPILSCGISQSASLLVCAVKDSPDWWIVLVKCKQTSSVLLTRWLAYDFVHTYRKERTLNTVVYNFIVNVTHVDEKNVLKWILCHFYQCSCQFPTVVVLFAEPL